MNVCISFPGRFGDILWMLPTARAISRRLGHPVHLRIAGEFDGIVPLLQQQPYLASVASLPSWNLHPDQRVPEQYQGHHAEEHFGYDAILNLAYRGWPEPDVVRHTRDTAVLASASLGYDPITDAELDLQTPWITIPNVVEKNDALVIAFTEVHFELKFGLTQLVLEQFARKTPELPYRVITVPGSRWTKELWPWKSLEACDWVRYAEVVQRAGVVLADCSAAHVLAVAMGVPTILMEPLEARWNPVFYPLGMDGPQVTVVKGTDGRPTFDARHTFDAVEAALR